MTTGGVKHVCAKCYGLDENGRCVPKDGERRDNFDLPIECDKFHAANSMLWYLMASSMNPNFKKKETALLVLLGTLMFFTIITFLMIFGTIPFFTVEFA